MQLHEASPQTTAQPQTESTVRSPIPAFPCGTNNAKRTHGEFLFHTSGHLWYQDSGMHSCSDKRGSRSDLVLFSAQGDTVAWPQGGRRRETRCFQFLDSAESQMDTGEIKSE